MKKIIAFLTLIILIQFGSGRIYAQCALCQAQVQTNSNEGNQQAAGLNTGILYLMSTPYLIALGLGVIWYKKYRKKNIILDMRNEPLHLN